MKHIESIEIKEDVNIPGTDVILEKGDKIKIYSSLDEKLSIVKRKVYTHEGYVYDKITNIIVTHTMKVRRGGVWKEITSVSGTCDLIPNAEWFPQKDFGKTTIAVSLDDDNFDLNDPKFQEIDSLMEKDMLDYLGIKEDVKAPGTNSGEIRKKYEMSEVKDSLPSMSGIGYFFELITKNDGFTVRSNEKNYRWSIEEDALVLDLDTKDNNSYAVFDLRRCKVKRITDREYLIKYFDERCSAEIILYM